jgi:hypothetical protein
MVNGTVNTTAPQQCGVRRIHDRINIQRRDISPYDPNPPFVQVFNSPQSR